MEKKMINLKEYFHKDKLMIDYLSNIIQLKQKKRKRLEKVLNHIFISF
jgi:hypothetical protein